MVERNQPTRMLPHEAANYIGCRYDKLMQMVRLREVPHYRIGRRVFFTVEGLAAWIRKKEQDSTE